MAVFFRVDLVCLAILGRVPDADKNHEDNLKAGRRGHTPTQKTVPAGGPASVVPL